MHRFCVNYGRCKNYSKYSLHNSDSVKCLFFKIERTKSPFTDLQQSSYEIFARSE
jgi:hypothetical protein